MKSSEVEDMEKAVAFLKAHNREQIRSVLAMALTVAIVLVLPHFVPSPFDGMVMGFGSAICLTAYVWLKPDTFRSRSGSLTTAKCLVAELWLFAVVGTAFSLAGSGKALRHTPNTASHGTALPRLP